jgi:hypothetical protein
MRYTASPRLLATNRFVRIVGSSHEDGLSEDAKRTKVRDQDSG